MARRTSAIGVDSRKGIPKPQVLANFWLLFLRGKSNPRPQARNSPPPPGGGGIPHNSAYQMKLQDINNKGDHNYEPQIS
jgi:hypothetical protein